MIVERIRDNEDKRIVMINLTQNGQEFIKDEKKHIEYYFKKVYNDLTEEEKSVGIRIVNKVISTLKVGVEMSEIEEKSVEKFKRITIIRNVAMPLFI